MIGEHVGRDIALQEDLQFGDRKLHVRIPGSKESDDPGLGLVRAGSQVDHPGLTDVRMTIQCGFYLAQFDPVAVSLDHAVLPSLVDQVVVFRYADQIARAIAAFSLMHDQCAGIPIGEVQVAGHDRLAADQQFTLLAGYHGMDALFILDIAGGIRTGYANREGCQAIIVDRFRDGIICADIGFRRPVQVEETSMMPSSAQLVQGFDGKHFPGKEYRAERGVIMLVHAAESQHHLQSRWCGVPDRDSESRDQLREEHRVLDGCRIDQDHGGTSGEAGIQVKNGQVEMEGCDG